jgi:spermidine synthase
MSAESSRSNGPSPAALRQSVLLFLFGFLGLSYEILASKVFFLYYTESSQSLSLVLSLFLIGLAVGSLLYSRYAARISRPLVFVAAHVILASYLCFALLHIDGLISFIADAVSRAEIVNQVIAGLIILLPPAVMLGTVFPHLLSNIVKGGGESHTAIGRSNAIDLIGSVTGALVAGFVFIPLLGIDQSIVTIYALHLLALVLFLGRRRGPYLIAAVFLVAFVVASAPSQSQQIIVSKNGLIAANDGRKVLYSEQSPFQSVTVTEETDENHERLLRLVLGKRQQCDTKSFSQHDVSEIHFVERALEQSGDNLRAVNVGLGCGLTAGLLADSKQVRSLDIVEINPKVPDAARLFADYNNGVLDSPKTKLIINDGYAQLRDNNKRYDLIAIDVEEPTVLHSSRLYSVENFQNVASRLNDDGVFALWAFNNFDLDFTKILHNSLDEAFRYIYVIQSGTYNDMYFLAAQRPLDEKLLKQSAADLALEKALATDKSTELQTLEHNALSRFWRQLSPDLPPKKN